MICARSSAARLRLPEIFLADVNAGSNPNPHSDGYRHSYADCNRYANDYPYSHGHANATGSALARLSHND